MADVAGDDLMYTSLALDVDDNPHIAYADYYYAGGPETYHLKYARRDGSQWQTETVDGVGSAGNYNSMALDSAGHPHISYRDLSNGDLKYARRNAQPSPTSTPTYSPTPTPTPTTFGTATPDPWLWHVTIPIVLRVGDPATTTATPTATPTTLPAGTPTPTATLQPDRPWSFQTIDSSGDVGIFTSIAFDAAGAAHISYLDSANYLKYATNASGQWSIEAIVRSNGWQNTSIAVDSTGKVYIAYIGSNWLGSPAPAVAIKAAGESWAIQSPSFFNEIVDGGISIAVDSNDIAHLVAVGATYNDYTYQYESYDLEYTNNSTGSFASHRYLPTSMTGGITLRSPSVSLSASGAVYVAYVNRPYREYSTNSTGTWAAHSLGGNSLAIYYSNRYSAVDSQGSLHLPTTNGADFTSLALDSSDKTHIVDYYGHCLRYTTDVTGSWLSSNVDCSSAMIGEYNSLAIDNQGRLHVSYYDRTNGDLKYAVK